MTTTAITVEALRRRVDCALGRVPCDFLYEHARVLDVYNARVREDCSIAVVDGTIVDVGSDLKARAKNVIDLKGALVIPGLIDAHDHIESSMVTPVRFARLVAPCGTTCVISDPHEIANVLGLDGIRFMIAEARRAEISIFFMLSSCVPSTPFESAGASLAAADLEELLKDDCVLGLAELMNVPGVLAGDEDLLKKAAMTLSCGKRIDGHSPMTADSELSAYRACGVTSDHECSTGLEMLQRLERGFAVQMREGSAGQNVSALSRAVTARNSRFVCLCTDDASPDDVLAHGHVNHVLRRAVACGIDPIEAVRMATINTAQHYGLKTKGAVAPGMDADFVVIDNLTDFHVKATFVAGRCIARDGAMTTPEPAAASDSRVRGCVNIKPVAKDDLKIVSASPVVHVIGIRPGDLITDDLHMKVQRTSEGEIRCCDNPGLLKLAVIERHHATGRMGLALLSGFADEGVPFHGAIASTVAHDSHNIVVVGDNDGDMLAAVKAIEAMAGGLVLVQDEEVKAALALEIAGLMTDSQPVETAKSKSRFIEAAHNVLHVSKALHPVMALSFLSLPVIGHLKVTDMGLFDVDAFRLIGIEANPQ